MAMKIKRVKKMKINYIDGRFWYYPSIWTLSIRKWASRPYKSINELMTHTEAIHERTWIDINKDPNFKFFNEFQKVLNTKIFLEKPKADQKQFSFEILPKVELIIPVESLKSIEQGKFFAWPLIEFKRLCQSQLNAIETNQIVQIIYSSKYNFDIQIVTK
ncbi:hypothetical protein [Mycoplasmopsis gallinacea]|uniref:Uncharacterized protein n=1 Tax=Mycoplasmopsis gallinacea TaxID=29556 RepID=A0A6H0V2J1_9BACT|nr:hypothetical protein [Mycoplasmopsis gallinacea]QIW62412.1 hypothetical protein GOQ20_03240 [Mycoplasmopsis gallinacea]